MTRRARTDSAAGAVAAFDSALSGDIQPPEHVKLRDADWPFWYSITRARAKDAWTPADLVHAASLARCMSDIERVQAELDIEGDTIENQRGTMVLNPKHSLLETLTRRSVALCRIVQIHAQATQGDSRDQKKRNTKARETKAIADEIMSDDDDGLLAQPGAMH